MTGRQPAHENPQNGKRRESGTQADRIKLETRKKQIAVYQRRPDDLRNMVKWQVFLLLEKGRETPRRKRKHQEGERKKKKNLTRKKKSPLPKKIYIYIQSVVNGSHMKGN